jgi:D-serine deaminase-like pyridoxal phosphate-dependent protein
MDKTIEQKIRNVIGSNLDRLVTIDWRGQGQIHPLYQGGSPHFPDLTAYEVIQYNAGGPTIVRLPGHQVCVGDRLPIMPGHANGTMNLYRQVVVHEGDAIRHIWPISAKGDE